MIVKKKLRDVTFDEFAKWRAQNCCYCIKCSDCIFENVNCSRYKMHSWTNDKKIFSDDFLNLEIEIEIKAPDILDKQEKEYLRNVIKPFRNRVKYITKETEINAYESIVMDVINPLNASFYFGTEYIYLPYFKQGTMYKNMEVGKKYTLEELGL